MAGAALLGLYASAKTQIGEDLRVYAATRKYLNGMKKAEEQGTLSLFSILERNAQTIPSAPSIYYAPSSSQETWASTYTTVLRLARFFHDLGVKPMDVVAINYTNKPTLLHMWLALSSLGAVPAYINYNLSGERLEHCIRVSGSTLLIVDLEVSDKVMQSDPVFQRMGVKTLYLDQERLNEIDNLSPYRPNFDPKMNKPTTMSCIFYTSGTTGLPKPAVFPLYKWYACGLMMGDFLKFTPQDRFYTSMPLYHGSANSCFMICLFTGGCFCIGHRFSVTRFWGEVRSSKATVINYVGETCRYLLSSPPSPHDRDHSVHSAFGNGLRPDVWKAFRDRFGITNIAEFYGASEGIGSTLNYNSGPYGVGAVGRDGFLQRFLKRDDIAVIKVDVDTLEPERSRTGLCVRVATNEPGEFLLRIPQREVFGGYFRNEKATEEKILRNVLLQGDMWFRSGDLLRQDADGFWYFVDRLGETFRWRSENVSTMEVAAALAKYPDFADIVVYGVPLPKHEGKAGCACVTLKPNVNLHLDRLFDYAKEALPKYAVPLFIRITGEIQTLENNKHLKGPLVKEGVNPKNMSTGDDIYWLKDGVAGNLGYVKFTEFDWSELESGRFSL